MALIHWWPLTQDGNDHAGHAHFSGTYTPDIGGKVGDCAKQWAAKLTCSTTELAGLESFSVAMWLRLDSAKASGIWADLFGMTLSKGSTTDSMRAEVTAAGGSSVSVFCNSISGVSTGAASFTLTKDVWTHIVFVKDSGVLTSYVNGAKISSTTWSNMIGASCTGEFHISDNATFASYNDVRLYSHPLTTKEIQELSKGLIVHYTFNGRSADYLEFTGTQYINTMVTGDARWEFDMQWTVTGTRQLMGYGPSGNEYWGVQVNGKYGLFEASAQGQAGNRDFIVHDYEVRDGHPSRTLEVNGVVVGSGYSTDVSSKNYGFGNLGAGGSYGCSFKLYRCRCIKGGVVVRDFIPWMSGGTKCLKDILTGSYYYNSGTGSFGGIITNTGNLIPNSAMYNYPGDCRGCAQIYDTNVGQSSLSCTGGKTGYSSLNGVVWNDAVYMRTDLGTTITPTAFTVAWSGEFKRWSNEASRLGSWLYLDTSANGSTTGTLLNIDGAFHIGAHGSNKFSNSLAQTGWHHYAITATANGGAVMYRDGEVIETKSSVGSLGQFRYILLGAGNAGGVVRCIDFNFSDFRVYMTALSANEIKALSNTRWEANRHGQTFNNLLQEGSTSYAMHRSGVVQCSSIQEKGTLPTNYIPLEYIESTGNQHINTEYYWSSENATILADIMVISNPSYQTLFGNEEYYNAAGSGPRYFTHILHGSNGNFGNYTGTTSIGTNTSFALNSRFLIEYTTQYGKMTTKAITPSASNTYSTVTYSGTILTRSASKASSDNRGKIYIFSNNNGGNAIQHVGKMRVYNFMMIDNNKVVRNFVPARQKSTGYVGLYDLIGATFYTQAAGSNFIAGPVAVNYTRSGGLCAGEINEI